MCKTLPSNFVRPSFKCSDLFTYRHVESNFAGDLCSVAVKPGLAISPALDSDSDSGLLAS